MFPQKIKKEDRQLFQK